MKTAKNSQANKTQGFRIPLKVITVSELNPRFGAQMDVDDLSRNVGRNGLLQPITLRQHAKGGFEVVIGSRRFNAILAKRGADGHLEVDEYVIVDWDDEFAIRASVAENEQREQLSDVDAGRFLNRIAERDRDLTDEKLAKLTGLGNRQRVSDLRALAANLHFLPAAWQEQILTPESRRSGDKLLISVTHFKHIRGSIGSDGTIPSDVRELMEKAAAQNWSAGALKKALNDLFLSSEAKAPEAETSEAKDTKPKAPVYKQVIKHLNSALQACVADADAHEMIEAIIKYIEQRAAAVPQSTGAAADAATVDEVASGTPAI